MILSGVNVLVGVTGGIAAYKSCELIRDLKREGADVRVMITRNAQNFITPITLQTLSGNAVATEMFDANRSQIEHISLADWPDVVIIAPATANTIARFAHGFADDIVSSTVLASEKPIVIAPAMNTKMWENHATVENIETLKRRSFFFSGPASGQLATDLEKDGMGRLIETEKLIAAVVRAQFATNDLAGVNVVVSAGRTEEYFDPVRMLTNRSTGKMGFAIAEMAVAAGANVTLISGPSSLSPPEFVEHIPVVTALEMLEAVEQNYPDDGVLIMSAAVSDFRPETTSEQKIKKGGEELGVRLTKNPDILRSVANRKKTAIHVGFALETSNETANATKKLRAKKLDLIVLNNPKTPNAGFAAQTNKVQFLFADGAKENFPVKDKRLVALDILNRVAKLRSSKTAA
mgnify:CR=1 FL=1